MTIDQPEGSGYDGSLLVQLARKQQVAVFRGEQEQEAIHQPQPLTVKLLAAQAAIGRLAAQRVVVGVLQQAIAKGFEGLLHAIAQLPVCG